MSRQADLQIFLAYLDERLGDAWRSQFSNCPGVQILREGITSISCDAIVSPANSFGFMDGGLDLALSGRFGWNLQASLQQEIQQLPERELLIGKTLVIATQNSDVPWLIAAPTMRVPMSFQIATSVNAYLAMKAILIAAMAHPSINTLAVPGLCTGVGRMPVETAAKQMRLAYEEIILGRHPVFADFGDAQKHHAELNPDGLIWDY